MIDGIKLNTDGISPNQMRIRLKELSGVPLTEDEIKRLKPRTTLLNEVVSMVQPTKYHDRIVTPPSPMKEPNEDYDVDLEEILREMGYGDDDESIDEVNYNSKGYKEGRKLVDKLRGGIFRKLNDDELDDFLEVLKFSFDFK